MKKLLFIIALLTAFTAHAQHSYIECTGTVILYSGSIERYASPDIYVDAVYHSIQGVWVATLQVGATGATTDFVKTHQIEFTNAEVDAFTPTGATPTEDIKNTLLQAVEDYLTTLNGGTTFTLH